MLALQFFRAKKGSVPVLRLFCLINYGWAHSTILRTLLLRFDPSVLVFGFDIAVTAPNMCFRLTKIALGFFAP